MRWIWIGAVALAAVAAAGAIVLARGNGSSGATAPQAPFTVRASLDRETVEFGDPVTATVTVQDVRGGSATATVTLQVVPRDTLQSGGRLLSGQSLTSSNGRYRLVYQTDGNLVLYDDVERTIPWASGTAGTSAGMALMQGDGNFVVYDAQMNGLWSTGTAGNANARLALQSDGNVVVYRADGVALWGAR